jgi:AcrR family transcriptional regulator
MSKKIAPEERTTPSENGSGLSEVAQQRRDRVIEAAIEIIATQGIHRLSLGNIEDRVQMARGHLTYYFPTKEDILLAVFDRMLERLIAEAMSADGPKPGTGQAWACMQTMFARTLEPPGPDQQTFRSLIHTFLAQTPFRDDFRRKIATAHTQWRQGLAADYEKSVPRPPVPPTVAASILMALMQGLGGQIAVDPDAFDRVAMLTALRTLLAPLFGLTPDPGEGNRP